MKLKTIILISLLLLSGVASAEFDGYTQYNYDWWGYPELNRTINFGDTLNVTTIYSDITNRAPVDILSNSEIITKGKRIVVYSEGTEKTNQVRLINVTHEPSMQSDGDDIRFISGNGTVLDQMLESKSDGDYYNYYVEIPEIDDLYNNVYFLVYGNASLSAKNDTLTPPTYTTDTESSNPGDASIDYPTYTLVGTNTHPAISYPGVAYPYYDLYEVSFNTQLVGSGTSTYTVYYKITADYGGAGEVTVSEGTFSEDYIASTHTFSIDSQGGFNENMVVRLYLTGPSGSAGTTQGNDFTSKAFEKFRSPSMNEPEIDILDEYTITSSVIGDSETDFFTHEDNHEQYIYPTADISNVTYVSDSPYWDLTTKVYWTENTAIITETFNSSYALMDVAYTPSDNVTTGYFVSVFNTIDLSQYSGPVTCLVDGSPATCSLSGNTVNVTLSSLDTSTHSINISIPYNLAPILLSPANESSDDYSFPPLQHDITLNWASTYADTYKYEVATDIGFNYIFATDEISANTTDVTLNVPDTYYWRIYGNYGGTYSPASDVWSFTMNATSTATGTGVNGVVYDASNNPISSATVNVYNNTWSASVLSTSSGYFQFTGLTNGTYFLQASKDGYSTSPVATATVTTDEIYTINLLIQKTDAANYILPHYVRFILTNYIYSYSDVDVDVYEGSSATPVYTGVTGDDGAIGFELSETTQYRITFIDATQGINRVWEGTPTDSQYYVIVFPDSILPETREIDNILFGCYGQEINLSSGYINASFNDTSGTTILAELWINDTNQTNLYYFNTTASAYDWSQVVNASNSTYAVTFKIQNTALDEPLSITRTISFFQDVRVNLGFSEGWHYILIACAILAGLAMLFSRFNAVAGAIVTILAGWFVYFMGWLSAGMSTNQNITIGLMLLLGTLLAFGTAINSGERRD